MKDLKTASDKCKGLLDNLGIKYSTVVTFGVNTRSRARWGVCKYKYGRFTIEVNQDLLLDENEDKALETVLLHELLHTVSGCMNHGPRWKSLADKVNSAYGYEVHRTNGAEEIGVHKYREREREYKYIFQCDCCGQVIRRQRASQFVANYDLYRCGRCNGKIVKVS